MTMDRGCPRGRPARLLLLLLVLVSTISIGCADDGSAASPTTTRAARAGSDAESVLQVRPVLRNLPPPATSGDRARIAELRLQLKMPEGLSARQLVNEELGLRGQPTIPDPDDPVAIPPTSITDGGLTTTTIDPAPRNRHGIAVYSDATGVFDDKLTELLQLELSEEEGSVATTPSDEVTANATVVLDGLEEEVGGQILTRRFELGPVLLDGSAIESATVGRGGAGGSNWVVRPLFGEGADGIDRFNDAAALCNSGAEACPTEQLAIIVDGIVISAPTINEPTFARDAIEISGAFSEDDARQLASALNGG